MSRKTKRQRSCLLVEVPRTALDDELLARVDAVTKSEGTCSSFVKGLVTEQLWIVFHFGRGPPKEFIRYAEEQEMTALPTMGVMQ